MSTCNGCKHWGTEAYEYWDGEGEEKIAAHRKCELVKLWTSGDGPHPPDVTIPFVRDASEYAATLYTPPTWTCPRFEAKS